MGVVETKEVPVENIVSGQTFTVVGSRNTPFMRTPFGYVNLISGEEFTLERGNSTVYTKPFDVIAFRRKYRMSTVQQDAWEEIIREKHKRNMEAINARRNNRSNRDRV